MDGLNILPKQELDGLNIMLVDEYDDVKHGEKRWSFQEAIRNLFAASLESSFPGFEQKPVIYASQEGQDGDYNCQNVLQIWHKIKKSPELQQKYSYIKVPLPINVGETIKENLPISAMIDGEASIQDVGFVAISLSRKWLIERIHKMLKDGIDTWASELLVKRVLVVDFCSIERGEHDCFQQLTIRQTLFRMLKYFGVHVDTNLNREGYYKIHKEPQQGKSWAESILKNSFNIREIGGDVGIHYRGKPPIFLAKTDFDNSYKHLRTLRYGIEEKNADWIIYVTPVPHRENIQMSFTAAKLEEWHPTGRNGYPKTSYVGYQPFSATPEFDILYNYIDSFSSVVAQGLDAKLLKYNGQAVSHCVFRYTFLKNHRLAACKFDLNEMFNEKENTFVYLLKTRAQIQRITTNYREDINELKKASELIEILLENNKEGGVEGIERALEFHLLEFTEVLKDSCLFVLPHILCDYLYNLSQKFTRYYSSVFEFGSVAEKCTLLLCEATSVVMETCFHLLGITPELPSSKPINLLLFQERWRIVKRPFVTSVARDPTKNSRFELFSIRSTVTTDSQFKRGNLFGLISVSDKDGLLLESGSHISEPDFAYVPLFNVDWSNPIKTCNGTVVYLDDPSFRCSVPFSSSIEIRMELNVISEDKDACYPLCNTKFEIDVFEFWEKKLNSKCGHLSVNGENAITQMYYILLRDAIDVVVEVSLKMETCREVCGYIVAYYDDCDFPFELYHPMRDCYVALLVKSDCPFVLMDDKIELKKSILAVPMNGSLIIEANLEDYDSGEVILEGSHTFKSQRKYSSSHIIDGREGTDFGLDVKVNWDYKV